MTPSTSRGPAALVRLDPAGLDAALESLAEILHACVEAGASVGFLTPFSRAEARAFFERLRPAVAGGGRVVLAARTGDGAVAGTAQLVLDGPPNGAHRAELVKLLVHPRARRQGLGAALLGAAEAEARARGRTLLVLDTRRGDDGERLYRAQGWREAGVIPGYARSIDGRLADTVFLYKPLAPLGVARASSRSPDAAPLLDALSETLGRAYGCDGRAAFASFDDADPRSVFALAWLEGRAVGCGALRPLDGQEPGPVAELKRMYAAVPRAGVGAALLAFLEGEARTLGYRALWLETRRANTGAIAFYAAHGFRPREPFGEYRGRPESICLEKALSLTSTR